jgi:rhodanese-related sulfurtransferase
MFRKIVPALLLAIAFSTAASAETLNGRMMFNLRDVGTMVLNTPNGLVALGHTADMKLSGVSSLNDLKVCDELEVVAAANGPALAIRSITFKKSGKPDGCPLPTVPVVPAADLYRALQDKSAVVYDVRNPDEFSKGHFEGAINLPLTEVASRLNELPKDKPIIFYCATTRRSAFASAILQQKGIKSSMVKGKFLIKGGQPQIEE